MSEQEIQEFIDELQRLCIKHGVQVTAFSDDEPLSFFYIDDEGRPQYKVQAALGQT